MGLENPTYVADLVDTNPVGALDILNEGDDHLRGIKRALRNTFPGFNGRIWRKRIISASGALVLTDNSAFILATQALTLTPDAASVLGNGWLTMVRPTGGTVTIDPGQPINGAGSWTIPMGYTGIIISDGTEFFGMLIYQDVPPTVQTFGGGTKIVFQQSAAPVGWTKVVSSAFDNAAIRLVTGSTGTGGADGFNSHFGTGKSTAGHVLTEAQMPAHSHTSNAGVNGSSGNAGSGIPLFASTATSVAGGNQSHSHVLNSFNIKYVDCIVASKD
jgi:hypothetical protein